MLWHNTGDRGITTGWSGVDMSTYLFCQRLFLRLTQTQWLGLSFYGGGIGVGHVQSLTRQIAEYEEWSKFAASLGRWKADRLLALGREHFTISSLTSWPGVLQLDPNGSHYRLVSTPHFLTWWWAWLGRLVNITKLKLLGGLDLFACVSLCLWLTHSLRQCKCVIMHLI